MKNPLHSLACAAFLACAFSTTAAAQFDEPAARSKTRGVSLAAFVNGSAAALEGSDEIDAGRGATLSLGYGFTDHVSVFASVSGASVQPASPAGADDYALAHADLGLRFSFASPRAAVRPFVQAAVSGRAASFDLGSEGMLDIRGSGFTGGVGVAYFVSPRLALEAGLSYTVGKFGEGRLGGSDWVDLDDEALEIDTSRFDLGLSWHP